MEHQTVTASLVIRICVVEGASAATERIAQLPWLVKENEHTSDVMVTGSVL